MMHLLVQNVDAWWNTIQERKIGEKYAVRTSAPELR
jgi:hypothetical protein